MPLVDRALAHHNVVIRTFRPSLRHARYKSLASGHPLLQRRPFLLHETPVKTSSVPNPYAKEVAVLGGGITGLSTAFNITTCLPDTKITIYEAGSRLGGWMNSETVHVDDGEVLFEWGPRTLRPALNQPSGASTIDLVGREQQSAQLCIMLTDIAGETGL